MCELIYRSSWNSVASFSRKLQSLHNIQHLCSFILCNNGPFKSPEHHCLDEEHTAHHHSALIQENLKRSFSDIISMKSSKMMPHVVWKCKEKIITAVHFSWSDTEVIKIPKMLWRKSTSEVLLSLCFELLRCCLECKLSDCQCLHFKDPHWSLVMNKEDREYGITNANLALKNSWTNVSLRNVESEFSFFSPRLWVELPAQYVIHIWKEIWKQYCKML